MRADSPTEIGATAQYRQRRGQRSTGNAEKRSVHADFRPGAQSYVGDRVDDIADFIEERLTGAEAVALVLAVATHHEISVHCGPCGLPSGPASRSCTLVFTNDAMTRVEIVIEGGPAVSLPVVAGHALGTVAKDARVVAFVGRNANADEVTRTTLR
jgi:hypothetical protein